ncbi:EEF2K [Symbiodinium natans]|uniref:EEF2K protein n=1 Tax=Symbiodinium natans TaxID=878477 RepID=A0A812I3K7_9DINO|nr:EEF2K [Symbiodinium natans]
MRHCYGFRDPGLESGHKRMRMVAKKQKWVTEPDVDPLTSVDIYAKQTAVAHYYARGFQKEVERQTGKLINLDFVPCYAYRPIAAEDEDLEGFCGEQFVSGEFVKLTSNAGFVNREEYGGHAVFGSAFSHYTFHYSSGALLVADIQGVCSGHRDDGRKGRKAPNREDENRSWVLSDPQVLTDGVSYQFGRGDLGLKGMSMFFKSHKCSWLCKMLGLKDITNIKRPTAQLYFPGRHLLSQQK